MKKTIITVFVVLLFFGLIATRYAWIRSWRTTLTSDGHPVVGARVYRNWSGDVLVDLRAASGDLYVIRSSEMAVGIPNASPIKESSSVIIATEHPLRTVDLRTDKAGGVDPKLVLTSDGLSFRADGKTIQVAQR
jgi:hypothetical protein